MRWIHWIVLHKETLAALSTVAVAVLTLVLIAITAIYVYANWRVMRTMEADLLFRSTPLLQFGTEIQRATTTNGIINVVRLDLLVAHAPAKVLRVTLISTQQQSKTFSMDLALVAGELIGDGETRRFTAQLPTQRPIESVVIHVEYSDIAGRWIHATRYSPATNSQFLLYTKPAPRHRLRLPQWLKRRK